AGGSYAFRRGRHARRTHDQACGPANTGLFQDVLSIGIAVHRRVALAAESAVRLNIHLDHGRFNSTLLPDADQHLTDRSVSYDDSAMCCAGVLHVLDL